MYTSSNRYFGIRAQLCTHNQGDSTMNHHWRQQANQCRVCHLSYKYILHLEKSKEENPFILKKLQNKNQTYVPGRYSWSPADKDETNWHTIPRKSAYRIYKHYFADFGSYNLSYLTNFYRAFSFIWISIYNIYLF